MTDEATPEEAVVAAAEEAAGIDPESTTQKLLEQAKAGLAEVESKLDGKVSERLAINKEIKDLRTEHEKLKRVVSGLERTIQSFSK